MPIGQEPLACSQPRVPHVVHRGVCRPVARMRERDWNKYVLLRLCLVCTVLITPRLSKFVLVYQMMVVSDWLTQGGLESRTAIYASGAYILFS
jgi:hypothetical protein